MGQKVFRDRDELAIRLGSKRLAPLNGEITLSDARICDLVPPDLSHHLSLIHDDATIGHGLDQGEILLDDDDRQSCRLAADE